MKTKFVIVKCMELSSPFGSFIKGEDIYWTGDKMKFTNNIRESKLFEKRDDAIKMIGSFGDKKFYNGINDKKAKQSDFEWMKEEMSYLKIEEIFINAEK